MANLLNNELKIKLTSFNNLMQMELFHNLGESMVALDANQMAFITQYALICDSRVRTIASQSLTGRPQSVSGEGKRRRLGGGTGAETMLSPRLSHLWKDQVTELMR